MVLKPELKSELCHIVFVFSCISQIPGSINQYLRDYQRDGVKFLYENYRQKTGAILGDDMGLGKTVQVRVWGPSAARP